MTELRLTPGIITDIQIDQRAAAMQALVDAQVLTIAKCSERRARYIQPPAPGKVIFSPGPHTLALRGYTHLSYVQQAEVLAWHWNHSGFEAVLAHQECAANRDVWGEDGDDIALEVFGRASILMQIPVLRFATCCLDQQAPMRGLLDLSTLHPDQDVIDPGYYKLTSPDAYSVDRNLYDQSHALLQSVCDNFGH
jgi:hypothetical protein